MRKARSAGLARCVRNSPLGIHTNFLELGVDSLQMTRVLNRLREIFALDIPLRWLFEEQTIGQLAQRIKGELTRLLENESPKNSVV
ncbi:acyl carrier protein [Ktedonosporobacter rubrisoli]|uniref:Acyl carrier protein n=2 Tax=Ktedonosporobacter rubrisoli TaxID=2509675 RepID=A0A4V0YYU0_KTERU|nr:acyl carrier protein [Ktedonosporobacter rubrisoli]